MRLKDARRERGLTQGHLAGKARVSTHLLVYAERGRFVLSPDQAGRIAEALDMTTGDVDELRTALSFDKAQQSRLGTLEGDQAAGGTTQ
jgi:transcriptional regulator with XRE-family HTH domain